MKKSFKIDKKTNLYSFLLTFYVVAFLWIEVIATKLVMVAPNVGINASALLLIYPFLYVISDFVQEIYGYKASRINCTYAVGFALVAVGLLKITSMLPTMSDPANLTLLCDVISGTLLAGFVGTWVGDWVNDNVFEWLRKDHIPFWTRAIGSSVPGEFIDAGIFYGVMSLFYWHLPLQKLAFSIIVGSLIKLCWETSCVPVSHFLVKIAKKEFNK